MQVVYALGNIELYSFAVNGHVGDAADGFRDSAVCAAYHGDESLTRIHIVIAKKGSHLELYPAYPESL